MKNKGIMIILLLLLVYPLKVFAYTKTETIYANLKANGSVEKTTFNSKLTNLESGDIEDKSNLLNIKNINGKETFSRESEKIIWKSTGKDIYYQGETDKTLPISIQAEYYLNGEKTTSKKMIGKSGEVKILIKYINNEYQFNEGIYTPYVVDTTLIINNKNNFNMTITNGKTISLGNKIIAMAITAPGLYESTNIEELKGLDQVEIKFQTTSFEQIDIYFVSTPKLLGEVDLEKINNLENMISELDQLQDGMNQIDDGTKELKDASRTIADKSNQLSEALGMIYEGQKTINSNIQDLNTKVDNLATTVNTVNDVIQNTTNSMITITEEQYNSLPDDIKDMIEEITGIVSVDQDLIISLQKLNYSLEATYQLYGLGDQDEQSIKAEYINNLDEGTIELLINTKKVYESEYDENESMIAKLKDKVQNMLVGEKGLLSIISKYLTQIQDASAELAAGEQQITDGLDLTYHGSLQLTDALNQVADATSELSSGISKMNEEGIHKISQLGNKASQTINKTKNIVSASKNYNGFSSTNANETVFIYKLTTN